MVELVITISIIIILLSILLPALKPAKVKADLTGELATQRQLLMAIGMYAADSKDYYPYFATPRDPYGPMRVRDFDFAQQEGVGYFKAQAVYWPSIVYPKYLSATKELHFKATGQTRPGWPDYIIPSTYFLTHSVEAAPAYWENDEPPQGFGLLHGTMTTHVRFPSNKTILLQMNAADGFRDGSEPDIKYMDTTAGMADGSAHAIVYPPVPFGDNWVYRPFGAIPWPSLSTRNGIEGHDY